MFQALACPHCSAYMEVGDELLGQMVQCPACGGAVRAGVAPPSMLDADIESAGQSCPRPPVAPPKATQPPIHPTPARKPKPTYGQRVARAVISFGLIGLVVGIAFGALASQFFPLFGGWLIQIAEPMSPARLQALPAHCLVGGIVGAVAAGGLTALVQYANGSPRSRVRR